MNIIIVGCGKVGYTIAKELSSEDHDVMVIDNDPVHVDNATNNLDVMGLVGNGASCHVQIEAGVEQADLLIAVTNLDELNLLCCMVAKKVGGCHTIARVHNPGYQKEIEFYRRELGLSLVLNPELATAQEIARLCKVPKAIEVDTFLKGHVEILKVEIPEESHLHHAILSDVMRKLKQKVLVCAVERGEEVIIPEGDFMFLAGDKISFVGKTEATSAFIDKIEVDSVRVRHVLIIGVNELSEYLAKILIKERIKVHVFDPDKKKCEAFSNAVPEAIVINADASKPDVLLEEGGTHIDGVVTLTDSDERNILISLYARSISKCKVVTLVNRNNYSNVTKELMLGSVVSPKNITAEYILQYVRARNNTAGSDLETLYRIVDGKVEALEFCIKEGCKLVGIPISKMKLKDNLLISCINHKGKVETPHGDSVLCVGDHVVVTTTTIAGLQNIDDIIQA